MVDDPLFRSIYSLQVRIDWFLSLLPWILVIVIGLLAWSEYQKEKSRIWFWDWWDRNKKR